LAQPHSKICTKMEAEFIKQKNLGCTKMKGVNKLRQMHNQSTQ